jgi:hypothetical protein
MQELRKKYDGLSEAFVTGKLFSLDHNLLLSRLVICNFMRFLFVASSLSGC